MHGTFVQTQIQGVEAGNAIKIKVKTQIMFTLFHILVVKS